MARSSALSAPRISSSIALAGRLGAGQGGLPPLGDLHAVAAPILGIAPALDVALVLELVEQQHDHVGVGAEGVAQLLLGATPAVLEIAEGEHQLRRHAEQLLVAAAQDLLGQPRQQQHRAVNRRHRLVGHAQTWYSYYQHPDCKIITESG